MRGILIGLPLIQLLIFGYAVNLDVNTAQIAWMDQDRTPESRQLRSEFEGSGRFVFAGEPQSDAAMQGMLDRGQVDARGPCAPRLRARYRERPRNQRAGALLDGTNSATPRHRFRATTASSTIARYSSEVLARRAEKENDRRDGGLEAEALHPAVPQVSARSRVWFNPDLRSRNFFIPGIIVNIITIATLSLTATAIVREKEIGTMEQLMVTPIRPVELILGKTLPFVLVGFWDMLLAMAAALFLFRIPFVGNFGLLLGATLLFLLTTLGAGLFISTVSRTQQQVNMATGLMFQPFFMLSGFTFPIRNMPVLAQWMTFLNPVRYFMEIVRGVFLQGAGMAALWPQMVALAVFGVAILWASVLRFHKQLE